MQPLLKFSFGKDSGCPFGVGHQLVRGERLPVGQRGQARVLLAAASAQIRHQPGVERLGSA